MSAAIPMNPWRKGREAAKLWLSQREAWNATPLAERFGDAPQRPGNPYPQPPFGMRASRNNGHIKWAEGFRQELDAADQRKRCGGKDPSWGRP